MSAVIACSAGATEAGIMGSLGQQEHVFCRSSGIRCEPAKTSGDRKTGS